MPIAWRQQDHAGLFFQPLREIIAWQLDEASPLAGEVEADESYFGGKRKGKRGRGAAGKVPVFRILKRGGKVYSKMIPDARAEALMPIINRMILPSYGRFWCLASGSSGNQINLRYLNTVFELYSSYHLGQVIEAT